jgi:threonine aldolase
MQRPDVDLRSDTVTLPSAAMFAASSSAPIGDDVLGEDATVRRLESAVAARLEREAGLFFPTGTMANLCALLTHASRGQRVVCGAESHVYCYEAGGASALGGLVLHPLDNDAHGDLDPDGLAAALAPSDDPHLAPPGVLALENTHNRRGGVVLARMAEAAAIAHRAGVPVHLDGARLWNAAVARSVPEAELARGADSVQVCLSKGLGAPLGSVLVSDAAFVARARKLRKMLGGGMRQAGVVAAMGLVALERVARLADDHRRARALADACRRAGLSVSTPETNIVLIDAPFALVDAARAEGVRVGTIGRHVRAVTHLGIDDEALDRAATGLVRAAARLC